MIYRTKQKRLCAIFDTYLKRRGVTAATMEEVAEWAQKNNLWPVPIRGASEDEANAWEKKLEAAK